MHSQNFGVPIHVEQIFKWHFGTQLLVNWHCVAGIRRLEHQGESRHAIRQQSTGLENSSQSGDIQAGGWCVPAVQRYPH